MGLFGNSGYTTVKVVGSLRPMFGKNVDQKKVEKIDEMERQGYELVSCTAKQLGGGGGFLGGFLSDGNTIEYTMVFRKV